MAVPPEYAGERLDRFLTSSPLAPGLTRSGWQRRVESGAVLVNGRASAASTRLRPGDRVEVIASAPASASQAVSSVRLEVLYEDPAMLAVDKPAGLVVHPAPGTRGPTLVDALVAAYPDLKRLGESGRAGIVHRLDRDTSGVLAVGRSASAVAYLQRQWRDHTVEKRYRVLVRGNISEDAGEIEAPIARDARYRQRMSVRAGGREARTRFTVLERFGDFTYLEALLVTGRTHQLRVHFAAIGRPVAADATYGGRGTIPFPLERQFLHAASLRLRSPWDEAEHSIEAPLPADLAAALAWLRRRGPR